MIGMNVRTRADFKKVVRRQRRANITSLAHAGASIRLTARRSILRRKGPSAPGTPPHTRRGQLRTAILYAVESRRQSVVIGPHYRKVGTTGMAHEFGGMYRGDRYPRRPFMGPALERTAPRLPRHWAGSIR